MDPTTVFCPNLACPARGQTGQGNIGIHSRKEKRFICTQCRKTFTTTKGTALYRLRTSAETVTRVVTLMARGVEFDMDKTETPVCWMAQFRDPDGNKLVVHQRKES